MTNSSGSVVRGRALTGKGWARHMLALLALVGYLAGALLGSRLLWARYQAARYDARGVAFSDAALPPGAGLDAWGVNTALERYTSEQGLDRSLDLLVAGGFRWLRQRFPWAEIEPVRGEYEWARWDAMVRQCQARGLRIIAVIDGAPAWARSGDDAANPWAPPHDPADLAAFARAFAARYGEAIDRYQVWDEPNIYPHWGERDPDPAAYLALLGEARAAILAADAGAVVATAGLAPTTETDGRNLSELLFLRRLYQAGGRDSFDAVCVKSYGFWSGPDDRDVAPAILNFSRLVAVREEMVRHGDAGKPVWAVTWGWNALPEGWQGRPSPWGNDRAAIQQARDEEAIERAQREWPWLALMCYAAWQPPAAADDPAWGLALLDGREEPGALYARLQALSQAPQPLYPGRHSLASRGGEVEIRFWGSRVDLVGPGRWQLLELDGRPLARSLQAPDGRAVTAVHRLAVGEHRLTLRLQSPDEGLRAVVSRERPPWLPAATALALVAGALLATAGLCWLLRPYPWLRWAGHVVAAYQALPSWAGFGLGLAAVASLALAPGVPLSLAMLALITLLVLARPDVGLMLAVLLVPLAPLQKRFGPLSFSYLEIVTLLTVASQALRELHGLWRPQGGLPQRLRAAWQGLDALDAGLALLVAAAFLSLAVSENLRVSLRELRVVVLQAAFLYWLLRQARLDRAGILRLADVLVLGATIVSLQGLYQYGWTEQVIVAEGVRRARGIYGSPNNLALVLGRALPVMLAMLLAGPRGRRRSLYGAAALPAAMVLLLTFSKGALFLGVPAALLAIGLLLGKRSRLAVAGVAAAGALAVTPLLASARFSSLFSLEGTSFLRIKLWQAAWDMVRDHPFFGVGLDNFLTHYHAYIRPEAMSEPNLSHPHDWALDFWLRTGLPGLAAFLCLQWQWWRRTVVLWQERAEPALRALAIGLAGAMIDMLAHGAIDAAFFVAELAGLFALMLGLVRAMGGVLRDRSSGA